MTVGKNRSELTAIADAALRDQPGCETARVVELAPLHVRVGQLRRHERHGAGGPAPVP